MVDTPCRTAAENLAGDSRVGFSKKPRCLQQDGAVTEHGVGTERRQQATSIESNTRCLYPSPACAHPIP